VATKDVAKEEKDEGWLTRSGVALAFEALAPVLLSAGLLSETFQFFISSTLGDQNVQGILDSLSDNRSSHSESSPTRDGASGHGDN